MKILVLCLAIILQLRFTDGQVPDKYSEVDEFRLERFDELRFNYSTAKSFCNNRGSWLVEIKTESIKIAFERLINEINKFVWIGGRYFSSAWRWEDGTHVVYNNWGKTRPEKNITNRRIQVRDDKKWFDMPQSDTKPFVCQIVKEWVVFIGSSELRFYGDDETTFSQANETCNDWDSSAHLVHIKTKAVDDRITNELKWREASGDFFTSGNDIAKDGDWLWGDGTAFHYTNWGTNFSGNLEPNGKKTENCLQKRNLFGWKWNDVDCDKEQHYICEKELSEDRCSDNLCSNGGTCIVHNNIISCTCGQNYQGRLCELDPCDGINCKNGGNCSRISVSPYFQCACYSGYKGRNCEDLKFDKLQISNCQYHISNFNPKSRSDAQNFCQNNSGNLAILKHVSAQQFINTLIATDFNKPGNFWTGAERIGRSWKWADNSVLSDVESGSANCMAVKHSRSTTDSMLIPYSCNTPIGTICEKPINGAPCELQEVDCRNGGTCQDVGCHYKCQCAEGYYGALCEKAYLMKTSSSGEQTKLYVTKAHLSCSYKANPRPNITWRLSRDGKNFNISVGQGSIFSLSEHTINNGDVYEATSNLTINLANCIGPAEVTCIASNSFESNKTKFQVNKRVRTISGQHFVFSRGNHKLNFKESETYCKNMAGTLAKIMNQETQNVLANASNVIHEGVGTRIGGKAVIEKGIVLWKWPDGFIFYNQTKYKKWNRKPGLTPEGTYVNWNSSEPVNNKHYCLNLHPRDNRTWADTDCNGKFSFICEKPLSGTPTIHSIKADECVATITVSWKPSPEAVGITHRIVFSAKDSNSSNIVQPDSQEIIPEKNVRNDTFTNLSIATTYEVKIYVCPEYCVESCHSNVVTTTAAGLPGKVRNVSVSVMESGFCNVTWNSPVIEHGILNYEISVTSTHSYYSTEAMKNDTFEEMNETDGKQLEYLHSTKPNRVYSFTILAKTCVGTGHPVKIKKACITNRAAPNTIPALTSRAEITDEGTVEMTFPEINEENGPISCVFIIVIEDEDVEDERKYNGERLRSIVSEPSSTGKEYITLALNRHEVAKRLNEKGEITLTIGSKSQTSCDVKNTAETARKRRSVEDSTFSGQNPPLDKTKSYGFLLVSSTPGDSDEVFYRTSEMTVIKGSDAQPGAATNAWIAGVIIAILIIVIIAALAVVKLKRDRQESVDIPEPRENHQEVPMDPIQSSPDPLYEAISDENHQVRSDTDIAIEGLQSAYDAMRLHNDRGFQEQFQKSKAEAQSFGMSIEVASHASLKKANRYKNILPYDANRVILSGEGHDAYINASYIKNSHGKKKYIATQGPLPRTINSFWRMVVEQKCNTIVMLTKCMEKEKKKCEQYWPGAGKSSTYGQIKVENIREAMTGGYVDRTLRLTSENKNVEIHQFQFLKWPDHGVPTTTSSFFRFHKAVMHCAGDSPIIIHCSAGAGRTGALIAYDFLSEEMRQLSHVDVYNCVLEMRRQRVDMVQNCHQYILVHKLLLEEHLFDKTELSTEALSRIVKQPDANARFAEEFSNLTLVPPINAELYSQQNGTSTKTTPYKRNRVLVKKSENETVDPFINASYIETYDESFMLIASEGPSEDSREIFWRAVFDNNISIIIMLTKCTEKDKITIQCAQYWPDTDGEKLILGSISVEAKKIMHEEELVTREFVLTKGNHRKTILQYQYTEWTYSSCPSSPSLVIDLTSKMMEDIRQRTKPTVLVHCSDGVGRTGAFCATLNLLSRLNVENMVDVFREVKDLRDCRQGMVQNLTQYRFCYETIAAYLEASNVYSNFSNPVEVKEEKLYENL